MADIQVRIQLQDTIPDEITGFETTTKTNNASSSNIVSDLAKSDNGVNMKSWATPHVVNGETVLGLSLKDGVVGGADTKLVSQNGYNGYVFGATSDNKELLVDIFVMGENIDSIIVYGDQTANQFPTRAYLNNDTSKVIYSDDAVWAIKFDTPASTQRITFTHWNRANYNACITAINRLDNTLVLDKAWIQSLDSLSQATGQPKEIYYGVLQNRGNSQILDVNGEIKDYIEDGILPTSNIEMKLYVNNNMVQSHISGDVNYDVNANTLSVDLTNSFDLSQTRQIINMRDNTNYSTTGLGMSFKDILKTFVFDRSVDVDSMLTNKVIVLNTITGIEEELTISEYLDRINVLYMFFDNKSKQDILNKICEASQLWFFKRDDGTPTFIMARPRKLSEEKTINILPKNMFSNFDSEIIIKNKYNRVKIPTRVVKKSQQYVYDKSFNLSKDGIDSLVNSIPDSQIIASGGRSYLQFYDSMTYSTNKFYNFDLNKNVDSSIPYPFQESLQGDTTSETGSLIYMNVAEEDKQHFNPSSYRLGSSYRLQYEDPHDNNKPYEFSFSIDITDYLTKGYNRLSYKILADVYDIETEDFEYGNGTNIVELSDNELVQPTTKVSYRGGTSTIPIAHVIVDNILKDYVNGIRTGSITISCDDYYFVDGEKAKDWQSGEIIQVGDLVKLPNDKREWRVTGRNFRYAGVPMLDLELQEVKLI